MYVWQLLFFIRLPFVGFSWLFVCVHYYLGELLFSAKCTHKYIHTYMYTCLTQDFDIRVAVPTFLLFLFFLECVTGGGGLALLVLGTVRIIWTSKQFLCKAKSWPKRRNMIPLHDRPQNTMLGTNFKTSGLYYIALATTGTWYSPLLT